MHIYASKYTYHQKVSYILIYTYIVSYIDTYLSVWQYEGMTTRSAVDVMHIGHTLIGSTSNINIF